MVSPAGGKHSQPLLRAVVQLGLDAPREPLSMAAVAVPDYLHFGMLDALKLFIDMTRFPSFETLHSLGVPLLIVLGTKDPLLPPAKWIRAIAEGLPDETKVAVIKGAAHAINFSHPRELSAIVRQYLHDQPIVGLPDVPDTAPVGVIRRR
jgi:pimeloyl-ACP methyl ester carboxylesterase